MHTNVDVLKIQLRSGYVLTGRLSNIRSWNRWSNQKSRVTSFLSISHTYLFVNMKQAVKQSYRYIHICALFEFLICISMSNYHFSMQKDYLLASRCDISLNGEVNKESFWPLNRSSSRQKKQKKKNGQRENRCYAVLYNWKRNTAKSRLTMKSENNAISEMQKSLFRPEKPLTFGMKLNVYSVSVWEVEMSALRSPTKITMRQW